MIKNYLKIAIRSLAQNKVYSFINVIGLTTALSVVLLISLYVKDDLSFDRFHKNGDQIFRLVSDIKDSKGEVRKSGNTGFIQGPIFEEEVPEINTFCRFRNGWNTLVKKGNDTFKEELMYSDNTVFKMFSFDLIEGDKNSALTKMNSVVITEKMAEKYFNTKDVIGETMYIGDLAEELVPFEVTGVVKSLPSNSSIQFDVLCNIEYRIKKDQIDLTSQSWYNTSINTFVMLDTGTKNEHITKNINSVASSHIGKEILASKIENPKSEFKFDIQYRLQPFFKMHLDPQYFASNGMKHWSDVKYPKILSGIALLIILLATINFVNLSLARSIQRSKEIGVRKTTGGTQMQLFAQFLSESMLTTFIAAIPAFFISYFLLPSFSEVTGKFLDVEILFSGQSILLYIGLTLTIALLAGAYPAFVMSGFKPMESLKGRSLFGSKNSLRQALVVVQFTLAGVLMIGTVFIGQQFSYINSKPLGYETANRYRFWLPWEKIAEIGGLLKEELKKQSDIEMVSGKSGDFNMTKFRIDGNETDYIYYEHIDDQHLQLMNIPLVAGRYFSKAFSQDTVSNLVVNESFVKSILPKNVDPLQHALKGTEITYNIVGVVKDFHYDNFKENIQPMVFFMDKGTEAGMVHVKIKEGRSTQGLSAIQSIYKQFEPHLPLEYQTLEEVRMDRYTEELREKKIITFTSVLAILIASLGLFGLATFMTEQRIKEIGIRKVLGAKVSEITILLSKDFIQLVILSFILAVPVGYYFVDRWLQNFTYRIDIEWWVFGIIGTAGVVIALITVSYQSLKTALSDPIKALRND